MIQEVSSRRLQAHISGWLKRLPLKVTRYGEPIAAIVSWQDWEKLSKEAEKKGELTKGLSVGRCGECRRWASKLTKVDDGTHIQDICDDCFEALKMKVKSGGVQITIL